MKKKRATRKPQASVIELPARLSISHSQELHRTLSARLQAGGSLLVDGSGVAEIDTAILQLLASAWIKASQRKLACRWQGVSPLLREAARLIGVSDILRFDEHRQGGALRA